MDAIASGTVQARQPKAADLIAGEIRRAIAAGELREGDLLPAESDLIEQFNASRPTIRESLRLLEAQSLITVARGAHGGSRITSPAMDITINQAVMYLIFRRARVMDLQIARETIEPGIVGYLARSATKADVAKLRAVVRRTELAVDDVWEFRASDLEFHELLVALARNAVLDLVAATIHQLLGDMYTLFADRMWIASPEAKRLRRDSCRAQQQLVEHLENRDARGAELLWERHLRKLTALFEKMGAKHAPLTLPGRLNGGPPSTAIGTQPAARAAPAKLLRRAKGSNRDR